MCKIDRVFDETIELKDNAMLKKRSELFDEWDFELNDELGLDIYKVTYGSNKKAWWKCEKGHTWNTEISKRVMRNYGCPYCSNRKVFLRFNDMWSTDPELAKLLLHPEDGYKYTRGSKEKMIWSCPDCSEVIQNKQINDIRRKGLSCPKCSDGIGFPEKFMYNLLKEAGIEFEYDMATEWSGRKRYDFYLSDYNWIIEVHGEQHSKESGFTKIGGRTLKEEQENDKLKYKLANENGVDNYISIDAEVSSVEYMRDSILNSDIKKIIRNIDFIKIGKLSSHSLIKIVCDIWNSGVHNTTDISKIVKLNYGTVCRYLKRGAEIGWCDYCPEEASLMTIENNHKKNKKAIIQLSMSSNFIKEYPSIKDALKSVGKNQGGTIGRVCKGHRKTAYGFKWMYKEDYDVMIAKQPQHLKIPNKVV